MPEHGLQIPAREEWLSLGDAAELLGVHPATLRQWADQGEIPSQRTPGGHRRFRRPDLEARMAGEAGNRADIEAEMVVHSAMGRTRLDAHGGKLAAEPWFEQLDEGGREEHRELGRRVAESLLRYLAHGDPSALEEARQAGHNYGLASQHWKLRPSDAVRAFLYFRDALTDSALRMLSTSSSHVSPEWLERFNRVNQFTNEILLALVVAYEEQGHAA